MKCQKCKREWGKDSEQSISIEFHGECVVCKFTPQGEGSSNGSKGELDLIVAEHVKRKTVLWSELEMNEHTKESLAYNIELMGIVTSTSVVDIVEALTGVCFDEEGAGDLIQYLEDN